MLYAAFAVLLSALPVTLGDVLPEPGTLMVSDRRIDVPHLPAHSVAYNPSIAQLDGHTYMIFRLDRFDLGWATQMMLGMVELNDQFKVMGRPTLLDTRDVPWANHTSEDPRLITHLGELYVIFNATHDGSMSSRRAMRIAHIKTPMPGAPKQNFEVMAVSELIPDAPGLRPWQEKNWTPFSLQDEIHLVYRTNPPMVYRIPVEALAAMPGEIRVPLVSALEAEINFGYGEMRGGSSATYQPDLDQYVSFFHARDNNNYGGGQKMHYFIGCYTFDPKPPFAIGHILPIPLVVPTMSNPTKPFLEVAYPGGFLADANNIYVVYGKNDRSIRLLTLDKAQLYDAMEPATPLEH
jgi:predicted GH43/DUF377 family glycosyl hydrolase